MFVVTIVEDSDIVQCIVNTDNPVEALAKTLEHDLLHYERQGNVYYGGSFLVEYMRDIRRRIAYTVGDQYRELEAQIYVDFFAAPYYVKPVSEIYDFVYKYSEIILSLPYTVSKIAYNRSVVQSDSEFISITEFNNSSVLFTRFI